MTQSCERSILHVLAAAILATGMLAIAPGEDDGPENPPPPPAGDYSLDFSQVASGASSSVSSDYSMEDSVRIASAGAAWQGSTDYSVHAPQAAGSRANNGLAINQGTGLRLEWKPCDPAMGAQGYHVYRSPTGLADSFTPVTLSPVTDATFTDQDMAEGTYYYVVYLVAANGDLERWTGTIVGVVKRFKAPAAPAIWVLY